MEVIIRKINTRNTNTVKVIYASIHFSSDASLSEEVSKLS